LLVITWRAESDLKKCHERHSNKRRSVDNVSQQANIAESTDTVANATAVDDAADSNLTLGDSGDASEPVKELRGFVIGLPRLWFF